jgi:hypothetical protein
MKENNTICHIKNLKNLPRSSSDWLFQCFNVCDLRRELDNSGAQFWLFDTDKRSHKARALFWRCVGCITEVRVLIFWKHLEKTL